MNLPGRVSTTRRRWNVVAPVDCRGGRWWWGVVAADRGVAAVGGRPKALHGLVGAAGARMVAVGAVRGRQAATTAPTVGVRRYGGVGVVASPCGQPVKARQHRPRTKSSARPASTCCGQPAVVDAPIQFCCPERGIRVDYKTLPVTIKTGGDLPEGEFVGLASAFDVVDSYNEVTVAGCFATSLAAGNPIPLQWEHGGRTDPRLLVGDIVEAKETGSGLEVRGRFDTDSEHGAAAWRNTKSRRVTGLSIGYAVRDKRRRADGVVELTDVDLVEVSLVTRGANPAALVLAVKSAAPGMTEQLRTRAARARVAARTGDTMSDNKIDGDSLHLKGRDEQLVLAKTILDTATELERDLTAEEAAAVAKHLDEAERFVKAAADGRRHQDLMAHLNALAADARPADEGTAGGGGGDRLTFKGMAGAVATKMLGEGNTKALAPSGAAVVGQGFTADPIPLGRVASGLLDILPVVVHQTAEFAYLRQTTRTNNAAVVADAAVKPTSIFGVTRIEATLQVIAHLSEGITRHWLLDTAALQSFIDNELRYGLGVAVEAKVMSDVNGTSGIRSSLSTSVLQTLRKAITRLDGNGYPTSAIVLHPTDWESVELALSSTNAIEHLSLPYDPAARRLFGIPVAVTVSEAVGTGHVLAQGAVAIDTDGRGIDVQWSESSNADDFSKNLVRARCEGRYATSVFSPLGVVSCDLTA